MDNILGWQDAISVPITLLFIYTLANWKYQKYKETPLGKYFFLGLHLKMVACVAHFAYHYYIYGGGDTFNYYRVSLHWIAAFHQLPWESLLSLFQSPEHYDFKLLEILPDTFYQSPNERRLTKITSPIGLLTFGSFISIGLWLSFFAYWGTWRIFKTFATIKPNLVSYAAISTLFIPSIIFWSGSISKDAVTMGCLGLCFHGIYTLFFLRKVNFSVIITFLLAAYLLSNIKGYIIVAFLPAAAIWILLHYRSAIQNTVIRALITPLLFAIGTGSIMGIVAVMGSSSTFDTFASDKVFDKIAIQNQYLADASRAGSAYDIGTIEPNLQSVISVFPQAVNIALFRPYLWEANNPAALLAALESTAGLLLFLFVFYKLGILTALRTIFKSPFLLFCLMFTIVFGAAVGLTSGNFGTLMRYKIPFVPFFFFMLAILYAQISLKSVRKFSVIALTE